MKRERELLVFLTRGECYKNEIMVFENELEEKEFYEKVRKRMTKIYRRVVKDHQKYKDPLDLEKAQVDQIMENLLGNHGIFTLNTGERFISAKLYDTLTGK